MLDARIRAFEVRLFRATLIARAAFPIMALAALVVAPVHGHVDGPALAVWIALVVWTSGTLPPAWGRLARIAAFPWIVRAEFAVFLLLVFVGLGSRSWHLLHAFVPLAFASYFLAPRVGRLVAAGMIVALWSGHMVHAFWPGAPIEEPLAAVTPTALALTGLFLVTYVRKVVGDADRLIAAQRQAGAALVRHRQEQARLLERIGLQRDVAARLGTIATAMPPARPGDGDDADIAALNGVLTGIRAGVTALATADEVGAPDTSLGGMVAAAVAAGDGFAVPVDVDLGGAAGLHPPHPDAVRRLLSEAITNARKHGVGRVSVRGTGDAASATVEVRNRAGAAPHRRDGHFGLHDMQTDADQAGARLCRGHEGGEAWVRIEVDDAHVAAMRPELVELRAVVTRRLVAYERAIIFVRLAFAVLTFVMVFVKADQHRTLLPAIVVTGAAFVVVNAVLLMRWRALRARVATRPGLVIVDAAVMVLVVALEGGMSCPWIPLSMGNILSITQSRSWRAGATVMAALGAALLVGYGLMRSLPVDDAGTLAQDMPFGWVFNMAAYGVVLAIAAGMRWVFDRTQDAADAYEQTVRLEITALRARERDRARAETRRELHATLRQYVAAAHLRLAGLVDRPGVDPDLERIRVGLDQMHAELVEVMRMLDAPDGAPPVGVAAVTGG